MLKRTETYNGNGELVEVIERPFTVDEYKAEIARVESQITSRRIREAVLTDDGKAWLAAKEAEIAALRAEMNNL